MFSFLFSPWGSMRHLWDHIFKRQSLCCAVSLMFIRWSRNMQILHAKFDKKISVTFIFKKKFFLIPLELKLLLNDKMINYKQKRQINFLKNLRSCWTTFRNTIPLVNLSVLFICFLFQLLSYLCFTQFLWLPVFFDQLTSWRRNWLNCVAFAILLSFSYIFLSRLFYRTTLRSCSTELYKSVVRQLKCWKSPVDARLQSWLILWITKPLRRMVPTRRDSSLYKIEKSCTREEQGRITISYGR